MNRHFQPNTQNVKTTAGIPTKSCTMIKTSKNSLCMAPQCPHKSKMADGHHLQNTINCYISATVWPILMKFCSDILGLQFIWAVKIFKFLKIQYSGWPQFWQELSSSWNGWPWPQHTWAEKRGAAVPLSWKLGPRLVQCGLGRGLSPYQVAS